MSLNLVVTYAVQCIAGLLLLVGGITSVETRWVGRALVISGAAFLVGGGLKLAVALGVLHGAASWGHQQLGAVLGGVGAGVLVTLFVAGEMRIERLRKKKPA